MLVERPEHFEDSPDLGVHPRHLAIRSVPFVVLAALGLIIAFISSREGSLADAWIAFALLIVAVGMFSLPRVFLASRVNVLIPMVAAVSAVYAIQASGSADAGVSLFLFVPVTWAALYLATWKSYAVLATGIAAEIIAWNLTMPANDSMTWQRSLTSFAFGVTIVFAIQELRARVRRVTRENEHANMVLRDALNDLTRRDHILTNISQGIFITDPRLPGNPIVFVSPSFERLTGYRAHELLGQTMDILNGPETDAATLDELRRCVQVGEDCTVELVTYRKDGTRFWTEKSVTSIRDDDGQLVNCVALCSNVTARRELEERLIQSQKMKVVGTLSAGMAHDFNNSLLVIRGYNSLIAQRASDEALRALAQKVDDAVHQASEVTHRLLAYSRFHESHPGVTDVNELLEETVQLWGRLLGDAITCELDLASDLTPILVDRGQLEQAVVNLITNGRDAMPKGGALTIRSSLHEVQRETVTPKSHLRPGTYVEITVADNGVGMDDETRQRMFEPFYTTKSHGTGLGLPTVENVIRQSGGGVEVTSELGRGTSFHLYLPTSPLLTLGETLEELDDPQLGGDETVLVVEDLLPARELLVGALREHGFHVLDAGDGVEALSVATDYDGPISLLVTDLDMPEMGGAELARRLLGLHHDLRVVFVSGYPLSDIVFEPKFLHRSAFVAKPYRLNELLREMRRVAILA